MKHTCVVIQIILFSATVEAATAAKDRIFNSDEGRACFVDILRQSGWGLAGAIERATFVVDQGNGSLGCIAWKPTHNYLSESFRGAIPPHTIAIAHTHPVAYPRPSVQDRQEASRIGLPIYVITLRGIYRADPAQDSVVEVVNGQRWIRQPAGG